MVKNNHFWTSLKKEMINHQPLFCPQQTEDDLVNKMIVKE